MLKNKEVHIGLTGKYTCPALNSKTLLEQRQIPYLTWEGKRDETYKNNLYNLEIEK